MHFRWLLAVSLSLISCGQIESYRSLDQSYNRKLSAPAGGVVLKIRKTRDLPNVFGRADIWGGKVNEGYTELRYLGVMSDGTLLLRLLDLDIHSNEDVFTRYMNKGTATRESLPPTVAEIRHNYKQDPQLNIFDTTLRIFEATPTNLSYMVLKQSSNQYAASENQRIEETDSINARELDKGVESLTRQLVEGLKVMGAPRLAVLPIEDATGTTQKQLGKYLTEKLTAKLHATGLVRIVERAKLGKVIDELALTRTGPFNENSAKRIGELLGTDYVIIGSYTEMSTMVEVHARAVKIETGEILVVGTVEIAKAAVLPMLK